MKIIKSIVNSLAAFLVIAITATAVYLHYEIRRVEQLLEPEVSYPIPNSIRVSFGPGVYEFSKTAIISTNEIRISLKEDTRVVMEGAYTEEDGWRTTIRWMAFDGTYTDPELMLLEVGR